MTPRAYVEVALLCCAAMGCTSPLSRTEGQRPPPIRFPVVYLDLDGTTLDSTDQPRPATLEALQSYRGCGGKVGFATGRSPDELNNLLPKLKPNMPVVVFNGAGVMDPATRTLSNLTPIDKDQTARFAATAIPPKTASAIQLHSTDRTDVVSTWQDLPSAIRASTNLIKVVVAVQSDEAEPLVTSWSQNVVGTKLRIVRSTRTTLEVLDQSVNKLRAIESVIAKHGVTLADVMAFGDGANDAEMLSGTGMGVAMENCLPPTCKAALVRTGSNDTESIARIIRQVAMGRGCQAGSVERGP